MNIESYIDRVTCTHCGCHKVHCKGGDHTFLSLNDKKKAKKLPYATECVLKAGGVSMPYFCTRHKRYTEGVSLYTKGDFKAACPHCLLEKEPAPGAAEEAR